MDFLSGSYHFSLEVSPVDGVKGMIDYPNISLCYQAFPINFV